MHRFFLAPDRCGGEVLTLDEADSHHATRVLRLQAGAVVEILDGAGQRISGRVEHADKRATTVRVLNRDRQERPPEVVLAPAVLKGRAMDFLVQKATELGAAVIQPVLTERTVVVIRQEDVAHKVDDWLTTAREACKQCGSAWMPEIRPPVGLRRFLDEWRGGWLLAALLDPAAVRPGRLLRAKKAAASGRTPGAGPTLEPSGPVGVLTGPEGDYTPEETAWIHAAGARPFTLGPLVLRGETAAVAALAIVQHELALLD